MERPALYSAFGKKDFMFRKALARYYERYMQFIPAALNLPTAREAASYFLSATVDLNTRFPDHTGCLGINGALAGSDDAEPVRQALIDFREEGHRQFRERFERALQEGDLPETADPDALATFVLTVAQGIAVQAKAGSCRERLLSVVAQAMSSWP